jgi:hypothetical protein
MERVAAVRQIILPRGRNCHASTEEAGIADLRVAAKVAEITFDTNEWKSR